MVTALVHYTPYSTSWGVLTITFVLCLLSPCQDRIVAEDNKAAAIVFDV